MKYLVLLIILVITSPDARAISPADAEDSIAYFHKMIINTPDDEGRIFISNKMREFFIAAFDDPTVFTYPFHKLKFSTITSSDKRVRIFNWNVPLSAGTHTYYCFVLVKNEKKGGFTWYELNNMKNEPESFENQVFKQSQWPGALYYEIIPMEKRNCKKYTLLGWEGKDNLSTRKIIEVMTISGKNLRFGDNVFKDGSISSRKRMVLEYSDEVSAVLKYYPESQTIVMDELAPKNPVMEGIYSEYGPLGTYNSLHLHKGNWVLEKDIDVAKYAPKDNRLYNDPSKMP